MPFSSDPAPIGQSRLIKPAAAWMVLMTILAVAALSMLSINHRTEQLFASDSAHYQLYTELVRSLSMRELAMRELSRRQTLRNH